MVLFSWWRLQWLESMVALWKPLRGFRCQQNQNLLQPKAHPRRSAVLWGRLWDKTGMYLALSKYVIEIIEYLLFHS